MFVLEILKFDGMRSRFYGYFSLNLEEFTNFLIKQEPQGNSPKRKNKKKKTEKKKKEDENADKVKHGVINNEVKLAKGNDAMIDKPVKLEHDLQESFSRKLAALELGKTSDSKTSDKPKEVKKDPKPNKIPPAKNVVSPSKVATPKTNENHSKPKPTKVTIENLEKVKVQEKVEKSSKVKEMCKKCKKEEMVIAHESCGHLISCMECVPSFSDCPICGKPLKGQLEILIT